ncbi:hypothetical protein PAXRUDRAFT_20774 [Paxillus rubicundulus Ve08.2h10]|uniref:Uncharacterized protein n=1 Tax=Paxillus rubicundulus Ve08.2h10 TaxID=930991 RepID=A0A0D0CD96_9AGAM|nr:hypothetical protein PAXRUDRAFT_20774 [Paxillus rubicundulus Ve08.2h10]
MKVRMDSKQALQLRVDLPGGGVEESRGMNSGVAGKRRYELRRSGKAELVFRFRSSLYFVSHLPLSLNSGDIPWSKVACRDGSGLIKGDMPAGDDCPMFNI